MATIGPGFTGRPRHQIVAAILLVVAIAGLARWLEPLPPRHVVLAAGPEGGYYHAVAQRYRERLARDGIAVTVRVTPGAVENLDLLRADPPGADFGFVQGGIGGGGHVDGVEALGSVFHEPVFVVVRRSLGVARLAELGGRRIAIGPPGSGTRALALALLAFNGLALRPEETLPLGGREAREALSEGRIDAAIFVIAHPLPSLGALLEDPALDLLGFERADAYRMRFPFLAPVRLPAGSIDLPRDLPPHDIQLVAPVAALVVREDLHSALKNLLARVGREIHGDAQLFAPTGQFPSAANLDFPLNPYARRLIEAGPSLFARYLPFWVAVWGERLLIFLLPVLGLVLPLWKLGPSLYRWRIERRIYRWYRDLGAIETEARTRTDADAAHHVRARLDRLNDAVAALRVPLAYAGQLYQLRAHIQLVRDRFAGGRE
jgi:TRAP transporter TAXI family solute receptor